MQYIARRIDRFLNHPDRDIRLLVNLTGKLERRGDCAAFGRHLIDKSPREPLFSRVLFAKQTDALGFGRSHEGNQPRQCAPLKIDTDFDLRYV